MRFSLDANVLVYSVDQRDARQVAALEIIGAAASRDCVLTIQALGEFFVASTRRRYVTRAEAAEQVRRWLLLFGPPVAQTVGGIEAALEAAEAGRFSYWDALLLATAGGAGCEAVISEDMGHGAMIGPVRVVRAFDGTAVSPEARDLLNTA